MANSSTRNVFGFIPLAVNFAACLCSAFRFAAAIGLVLLLPF